MPNSVLHRAAIYSVAGHDAIDKGSGSANKLSLRIKTQEKKNYCLLRNYVHKLQPSNVSVKLIGSYYLIVQY